jgi:hypothetical protein
LAIVVPAWSLGLAFVVGLVVGVVGCRLVMGRGRSTETATAAAPTEPEPAAPSTPPAPPEPVPEPEEAAAPVEAPAEVSAEVPASAVDDVVAELERRVKGRRPDGEADRTTGGRRKRGE